MQPEICAPVLAQTALSDIRSALAGAGLWLDCGLFTVRLRSDNRLLPAQIQQVYGAFEFRPRSTWADVHIDIRDQRSLARPFDPELQLSCDGHEPFADGRLPLEHFPVTHALPFFEWGGNWVFARRFHTHLLLHAGVVERDGLALILPAVPGSGKSTLVAALAHLGWRLLSDEFGAIDPLTGLVWPVLKPIGLKNESIDIIRNFCPQATFGPAFEGTHKGTVAHVAPDAMSVAQRHTPARVGAILMPRWQAGSELVLEPLPGLDHFASLSFNSFNYPILGETGYDAAVRLARTVPAWRMTYSDLRAALRHLDGLWAERQAELSAGALMTSNELMA